MTVLPAAGALINILSDRALVPMYWAWFGKTAHPLSRVNGSVLKMCVPRFQDQHAKFLDVFLAF